MTNNINNINNKRKQQNQSQRVFVLQRLPLARCYIPVRLLSPLGGPGPRHLSWGKGHMPTDGDESLQGKRERGRKRGRERSSDFQSPDIGCSSTAWTTVSKGNQVSAVVLGSLELFKSFGADSFIPDSKTTFAPEDPGWRSFPWKINSKGFYLILKVWRSEKRQNCSFC